MLLGHLAPLEGVEPSDLTIGSLVERVRKAAAEGPIELILGTNPNLEGDGTSLYIAEKLSSTDNLTLSRLARGLPAGSQLEYANKAVLMDAIASRQSLL